MSGVVVEYAGGSGYFIKGSGSGEVQTDDNGLFHINDSKGVSLIINRMHKKGFEIKMKSGSRRAIFDSSKRFPDSEKFQSYSTESTAYIFKAWKLNEMKSNALVAARYDSFILEREYWMDFTSRSRPSVHESQDSLKFLFSKQGEVVTLNFEMMHGGGLLEVERKQYMNIAPDSGYQASYSYKFDANQGSVFNVTIKPNYKSHTRGYINFRYQTNLDGKRILEL